MTKIFKSMPFGSTGGKRQHWIQAVQGLNSALFIYAENHRIGRGFQIEPDHISRLFVKIGIITGHVAAQPMRFESSFLPRPCYAHVTDPQLSRQFATAPVGGSVFGSAPCAVQDFGFQIGSLRFDFLARMPGIEASQPLGRKTLLPQSHGIDAASEFPRDGPQALAFAESEQNISAPNIFSRQSAATHPRSEFGFSSSTHLKLSSHAEDHYLSGVSEINVTVH